MNNSDSEEEPVPDRGLPSDAEQPQFGMLKFRRSGKSSNINSDDPENPNCHLEVSSKEIKPNGQIRNIPDEYKNDTIERDEKFQPMSIGSARSSSRNSFVMKFVYFLTIYFFLFIF